MNTRHHIFLTAAAVLCAISCREQLPCGSSSLIRISPEMYPAAMSRAEEPDMHVVYGTSFPAGRQICVSASHLSCRGPASPRTYLKDVMFYSDSSGEWKSSGLWPAEGTLSFLCLSVEDFSHLAGVEWGELCSDSVAMHVSDFDTIQDDILVGACGEIKRPDKDGPVPVIFSHSLSLLSLKMEVDGESPLADGLSLEVDGMELQDVMTEADLNVIREGSLVSHHWSGHSAAKNLTLFPGRQILVIPQCPAEALVRYSLHDSCGQTTHFERMVSLAATSGPGRADEWQSGKHYIYHLHFSLTDFHLEAAVEDWTGDNVEVRFK